MIDEINAITRLELLEEEVSNLKGIIHVMLEELENGSIEDSARKIREALEHFDSKQL